MQDHNTGSHPGPAQDVINLGYLSDLQYLFQLGQPRPGKEQLWATQWDKKQTRLQIKSVIHGGHSIGMAIDVEEAVLPLAPGL